jgi:hypothetical protein
VRIISGRFCWDTCWRALRAEPALGLRWGLAYRGSGAVLAPPVGFAASTIAASASVASISLEDQFQTVICGKVPSLSWGHG